MWQEKCKENPRKNTDKERTFLFFSSIQYSTASHEIKAVCDSTYSCRRYPFFCSPAELGYIESRDQCSYQSGHFPIFLPTFLFINVSKSFFAIIILRHQKHLTNCYTFLFRKFQVNKSVHLRYAITRVRKL